MPDYNNKPKKVQDLNHCYNEAESALTELFAEQRSNILLVAGHHYAKRGRYLDRQLRGVGGVSRDQRIRLVKNHVQKISKGYLNNILSYSPIPYISPKNKSEFHDQKVAEMGQSIWMDMRVRNDYDTLRYHLAKDLVEVGEAWLVIRFDPTMGDFVGYEPIVDDEGNLVMEDDGETPKARPVFTGGISWERVLGFNVLTDPGARSWNDCRYAIIRKMVPTKDLESQFAGDEEKLKFISDGAKQTYMLFDSNSGTYGADRKGLTMVREYYYRPCAEYPNGYFYIATEAGILFQGELPLSMFPVFKCGFDDASTSARSFSIIKQLRPYQAEINRTASKIAEHQVTLGDDKIVTQLGAPLTPGATAHGVKAIQTQGQITHLPGRDGSQFVPYMESQIREMYDVANYYEDAQEVTQGNLDPYALLFRSIKERKKFRLYVDRFVKFQKDICFASMKIAKANYTEDMVVQVLDKKEIVNIAEFKSSDDLSSDILVDEATDDVETKIGRQMTISHILQYAGDKIGDNIGQFIRAMPFVNDEEIYSDLVLNADNFKADVLAMDRGIFVAARAEDDHDYYIRRLNNRMKMQDFQFLHPAIQSNYQIKLDQHYEFRETQRQQAAMLQSGFIPAQGFLVKCDVRVPDPVDPNKTQILKLPVDAISWLVEKLEQQGMTTSMLQAHDMNVQAAMGENVAVADAAPIPPGIMLQ